MLPCSLIHVSFSSSASTQLIQFIYIENSPVDNITLLCIFFPIASVMRQLIEFIQIVHLTCKVGSPMNCISNPTALDFQLHISVSDVLFLQIQ